MTRRHYRWAGARRRDSQRFLANSASTTMGADTQVLDPRDRTAPVPTGRPWDVRGSLDPPAMVEFVSMTRAQAQEYLARFLAEMPACEQRPADTAAATGGPDTQSLDHTPVSLGPLRDWAAGRLAWRGGSTPVRDRQETALR